MSTLRFNRLVPAERVIADGSLSDLNQLQAVVRTNPVNFTKGPISEALASFKEIVLCGPTPLLAKWDQA